MSTDVCLDQRGSELTRSRPAFRVTSGDAFNPRTGTPGPNGWWSALRQTMLAVQLTSAMLALAFSAGATPQSAGRLTGKTYVITGASSGFGRGVALKLGAQGYGTLVNVGSIDGEVPLAYQATYSATKAGVLALDRALNEELRLNGLNRSIKVSTIMPWAADTPLWQHAANYTGRTPRMAAMDDPNQVADAIIRASVHPREAVPVGWKAQASYVSHRILPTVTERVAGKLEQHQQMQKAGPAPLTAGTLYRPMQAGQGVEGGARARMKQEDEQGR